MPGIPTAATIADARSPAHRSPPCSPQQLPRAMVHQASELGQPGIVSERESLVAAKAAVLVGTGNQQNVRSAFLHPSQGRPGQYFEAVSKLGEGAFGVAHLVRDRRSSLLRVLKTINKRQSQVPPGQLEKEIRNLKACDHPHIIRLFEYYEDYENIYLIMEHAEGGELHQVLEIQKNQSLNLPERWVSMVVKQCLLAISYVHSQGIIHKDLKTQNILLLKAVDVNDMQMPPHAVIIDLGIAELFSARLGRRARCTVVAGTPTHMAPEVWRGNFGPVADVWSLGIVMFELLSGEIPFQCSSLNSPQEWVRLHRQGPNWSLLSHNTSQARAICQRMLSCDERMRPTAQQCLGHAWFKEENGGSGEVEEDAVVTSTSAAAQPPPLPNSAAQSEAVVVDGLGEALGDYLGRSKFEKAVMLQVASQVHTEQISRIAQIFAAADTDYDGFVTRDELFAGLLNLGVNREDAESYASCLDVDANGVVEYIELVSGCVGLLYESLRGLLWQSFCVLDVDGNGVLDPEEVQAVVTRAELIQHGFPGDEPPANVRDVINRMDMDGNGQISFDELCRHFLPKPDVPGQAQEQFPGSSGSGGQGGIRARALQDEEFAQLLDEIEADHGRVSPTNREFLRAATAPLGVLHSTEQSAEAFDLGEREVSVSQGALKISTTADLANELEAMGVTECGGNTLPQEPVLPPGNELAEVSAIHNGSAQMMSVDEELSQLLADVANGP